MFSFKKCYIQVILFKYDQMLQVQVLSNPADNWILYTDKNTFVEQRES